jgi:hypothetical protein
MSLRFHRSRASERFFGTSRIAPCLSFAAYFLVFRLFPYSLSDMSRSIGEALPDDALDCDLSTLNVIYTEPDAIAVAKIELGKIPVQVLFAAMLVDALHAALEDRIVALDGVGVNLTTNIFFAAVVHAFVAGEVGANFKILTGFVGHQRGFTGNVGADNRSDLCNRSAVDMEAAGGAAALHESQNSIFVAPSGATLGLAFLTTDKGFIRFHNLASAAHGLDTDNAHGLTQAMRHKPSSLEGNAQGPMKLIAADAFLAGAQQIHRLNPKPHRNVAGLENGPNLYGKLFAALIAFVKANAGCVAAHLADALGAAAMGAVRTVRPHVGFNPGVSGGFVVEGIGFDHGFGHGGQFLFVNQPYRRALGLSTIISPCAHVDKGRFLALDRGHGAPEGTKALPRDASVADRRRTTQGGRGHRRAPGVHRLADRARAGERGALAVDGQVSGNKKERLEPDRGTITWFKQRKRILLQDISALDDFNSAHLAIERILEAADDWTTTDPTNQLTGALFMIAVVTYARQFIESSGKGGRNTFGIRRLKSGTNFDRDLHKQLVELRHKLIAHDDKEALPPALYMYGVETKIDGEKAERKPIAATLASYSFNSIATPQFLRKMQRHLLSCIEVLKVELHGGLSEYLSEAGLRARPQITCTVVFRRAVICQR